jgi:tetratricopeptide (TPR) repeat protein
MFFNIQQRRIVVLVIASALLFIGLAFLPVRLPEGVIRQKIVERISAEWDFRIEDAKEELTPEQLVKLNELELAWRQSEGENIQKEALLALISFWDKRMKPLIAAIHARQLAELDPAVETWLQCGSRFLHASSMLSPEDRLWALTQAESALQAGLELDPEHPELKTGLATAIVEKGDAPMRGIAMLREVHNQNPEFLPAVLQFGHFSVLSGQYSEAIGWYDKALALDSSLYEVYFYKGEVYLAKGEQDSAFASYHVYRKSLPNNFSRNEFDNYLEELKKHFN